MYNIHNHYENIAALVNTIISDFKVTYLHPFGTTKIENLEHLSVGSNGPILFCYDQEPLIPEYNKELFDNIFIFRSLNRSIILLNTERNSLAKNEILKNYGFIDCYSFFHIFAATDWYRSYQYNKALTPPADRKIKKKYITFNRLTGGARVYRSIFVGELAAHKLLDDGHVSYSEICEQYGNFEPNLMLAKKTYNLDDVYINGIIAKLHEIGGVENRYPLRIDNKGDFSPIANGSFAIGAIPQMMESFLHVVTETCFWETKEHLTEKIFKPIVAKQPFVLLGCAHNLAYLKSYGFKTFDSWWSERYDTLEDPLVRIKAVVRIIEKICSMSNEELEAMLKDMQEVLDHNYNLFFSREFVDSTWNELETNLRDAIAQLPPQTFLKT